MGKEFNPKDNIKTGREPECMYFITCMSKLEEDDLGWPNYGTSRTFGYYKTFEDCDESLKSNACDMHERLYMYAVVEKIEEGIHPLALERWWYKYDAEKDGFFPMKEPKFMEHFINIALG